MKKEHLNHLQNHTDIYYFNSSLKQLTYLENYI